MRIRTRRSNAAAECRTGTDTFAITLPMIVASRSVQFPSYEGSYGASKPAIVISLSGSIITPASS